MRPTITRAALRRTRISVAMSARLCLPLLFNVDLHAAAADQANRFYEGGVLVSLLEPAMAIDVDDSLNYAGRHPIRIRDVAAGERFVFVDAEGQTIRRLFIVQFEGFLPGIDDFYRYDLSGSPVVAGYPFRSNGYAFDIVEAIAANPHSESASTYPFLEAKGFSVPEEWMMWRSLTIVDHAARKELILFYVEDVASSGLTLADLYRDDEPTAEWIDIQEGLEERANRSFRLTELSENGEPVDLAWSSIPNNFTR